MIRMACILEIESVDTVDDAVVVLNTFREVIQPAREYGILIAWATREDLTGALTADGIIHTVDGGEFGGRS